MSVGLRGGTNNGYKYNQSVVINIIRIMKCIFDGINAVFKKYVCMKLKLRDLLNLFALLCLLPFGLLIIKELALHTPKMSNAFVNYEMRIFNNETYANGLTGLEMHSINAVTELWDARMQALFDNTTFIGTKVSDNMSIAIASIQNNKSHRLMTEFDLSLPVITGADIQRSQEKLIFERNVSDYNFGIIPENVLDISKLYSSIESDLLGNEIINDQKTDVLNIFSFNVQGIEASKEHKRRRNIDLIKNEMDKCYDKSTNTS
eukprot:300244_1